MKCINHPEVEATHYASRIARKQTAPHGAVSVEAVELCTPCAREWQMSSVCAINSEDSMEGMPSGPDDEEVIYCAPQVGELPYFRFPVYPEDDIQKVALALVAVRGQMASADVATLAEAGLSILHDMGEERKTEIPWDVIIGIIGVLVGVAIAVSFGWVRWS